MRTSSKRTHRSLIALFVALLASTVLLAPPASAEEVRPQQWYLDAMQAERMWRVSTGEGITVAVIDRKVDASVPELQGQLLPGKDLSGDGPRITDDNKAHGTNMAILIAGKRGGNGAWGLAPGAKILPLTAEDIAFDGIVRAIRYAADQGAQIINISQSASALEEERVELQKAIDYANGKGSLILAGTGNHGEENNIPTSPADLPGVVGIGAIDESLKVADFSVYGAHVGLTAPGVNIPSRCDSGYCARQGTSDATALASASAALVWSKHPDWTSNQVLRVLMETAGKPTDGEVPSKYLGYGVVRPNKVLLDNEGDPGPPDVNPLFPNYEASEPITEPSPSTEPTGSTPAADGGPGSDRTDHASDDSSTDTFVWFVTAGVVAVVVLGGGTAFLLLRRRARH